MQSMVLSRESIASVYAIVIPVLPLFATSSFAQSTGIHSDTVIGAALRRACGASCIRLGSTLVSIDTRSPEPIEPESGITHAAAFGRARDPHATSHIASLPRLMKRPDICVVDSTSRSAGCAPYPLSQLTLPRISAKRERAHHSS